MPGYKLIMLLQLTTYLIRNLNNKSELEPLHLTESICGDSLHQRSPGFDMVNREEPLLPLVSRSQL